MPEIILVLETNLILISAFKKNDHLVSDYLNYREKHFNVIKRQFTQLIILRLSLPPVYFLLVVF
jgi:hypothetical protein